MRRQRRAAIAVAAVPLLALGLAGCGSQGDGKNAADKAAASRAAEQERVRQFAKCMRENGVDMPDPEVGPDGGIKLRMRAESGQKGAGEEESRAAMNKCRKYMPNGGKPQKLSPQDQEKLRQFARCMREHGVKMDDPRPEGGIVISRKKGDGLSDEEFEAAQRACQKFQPRPKVTN
ncbi:hypothetical protein SAMN04489712_1038 [Thermomonospora echinospora]|uniref:Lipoprotein n=1 Tax=Thermomonospora echinospora TaxID=1992 RepID=A0A1H5WYE4_9ACTN|nr:hypothetical protein [Thermomonospora echinospora]SEG04323.1 hypothetical protein SAMN04489712_1038 [Thermomonospora echinospora]